MKIRTKKYQMDKKIYRKIGVKNAVKSLWYVWFVPAALFVGAIFAAPFWLIFSGVLLSILYLAFWWIQFTGIGQLPQFKTLFERLSYEIDSRQILIKLNPKEGMPLQWTQIKSAWEVKEGFVLMVNKFQIIYLPHKIFNSQNEINFLNALLKKKGYIKG